MTLVKQWETWWTISSNEMPGNTWCNWAFVIRPSPDSSSVLKIFSSFSTYFASKSTKTRMKRLHWADVVQGQARDMKAFSSVLSLNPLQLQDHYSTTEYSEPIRLLDQVAPLQHEQCCFVPFRSVVTYSCICHIYCLSMPRQWKRRPCAFFCRRSLTWCSASLWAASRVSCQVGVAQKCAAIHAHIRQMTSNDLIIVWN